MDVSTMVVPPLPHPCSVPTLLQTPSHDFFLSDKNRIRCFTGAANKL
jgi:hypothetical protein